MWQVVHQTACRAVAAHLLLALQCAFRALAPSLFRPMQVHAKLGPGAAAALAPVLYVYLLLSCTAYLMIAADCLFPLLASAAASDAWWASRQAVVAAVGLGVALPLSLPRTLGAVAGEGEMGWGRGWAWAWCLVQLVDCAAWWGLLHGALTCASTWPQLADARLLLNPLPAPPDLACTPPGHSPLLAALSYPLPCAAQA